jgi:hypothetical protein
MEQIKMDKDVDIEAHKAVHALFEFFLNSMQNRLNRVVEKKNDTTNVEKKNDTTNKDESVYLGGITESK